MSSILHSGDRLGRFVLGETIRAVASSIVFRGREEPSGHAVIVKATCAGDHGARKRFLRETRMLARLDHPNVARILDSGQNGLYLWFAAPDLGALDLSSAPGARPPEATVDRRLRILTDVLRGLEALHDKGIVHRDLNPDNVLVLPDGTSQVADLGLAVTSSDTPLTGAGGTMGTGLYLTPEQLRHLPVGPESDLYQWALVAYWLFADDLPFPGEPPLTRSLKRCASPFPPLASLGPALPGLLSDLVERNLSPQPEQRHRSATELLEDLEPLTRPGGRG